MRFLSGVFASSSSSYHRGHVSYREEQRKRRALLICYFFRFDQVEWRETHLILRALGVKLLFDLK